MRGYCGHCGTNMESGSIFCTKCGEQVSPQITIPQPDWDSYCYDDETELTQAEVNELYSTATEDEAEYEFDLPNADDEGPGYYRKVLAIVRWRRENGF